MRTSLLLCTGLAFASAAHAQQAFYSTSLTGHQQVPSVASLAEADVTVGASANRGAGEFLVNLTSTDTLRLTAPIDEEIGAHIHLGYTGENGPVVLALPYENIGEDAQGYALARLKDTSFFGLRETFYDSLNTAMAEGRAYINVHTLQFPGGEVRGQLINRAGLTAAYDAMAYGEQENPAVLTDGMGGVYIEVRSDSMFVTGAFSLESPAMDVAGTPAHLHLGSFGQNGGVQVLLTPTLSEDRREGVFERTNNRFAVPDGLPDSMFFGRIYLNVHSEAYPSGEIRGQVVQAHSNAYFSHVSDINPSPDPIARGYLRIMAEKPVGMDQIAFSGSYQGFGRPLADFGLTTFVQIQSPFASDGDPLTVFPITPRVDDDGDDAQVVPRTVRPATPGQLRALYLRYLTRAGVITNQGGVVFDSDFYHECKRAFYSSFTAAQSIPSTPSAGFGEIITEYYGNRVEVNGFVTGLSSAIDRDIQGGFHIHNGLAGSTGPIVAPVGFLGLTSGGAAFLPDRAIVNLTPEQATAMKQRRYYYNIHTENYPMGEVRSQILPRANSLLHAVVGPTQAFPGGAVTEALGGVLVELDAKRAVASGSFNGLNGFDPSVAGGAHLHAGMPGVGGPIVYPLATDAESGASSGEFLADANTIMLERPEQLDSMVSRMLYVNIHSTAAPSGEIRGQVAPYANNVAVTALSPEATLPFTGELSMGRGTGRLVGEVYDTTLVVYGTVSDLASPIDTSIAGGAHMHDGYVGQTGNILFGLNFDGTPDTTGTILADDNEFELTPGQVALLLDGGIYANFHTLNAQSGAVRGQMLLGPNRYPGAVDGFTFPMDGDTVRLADADLATEATIDWDGVDDVDDNRVGYYWTLFTDTTAAPVVRTEIDTASQVVFTFGTLDTLLLNLGVDSGAQATVYHRAYATDGALVTPGAFSAVTFVRRGLFVGIGELAPGAARLVNTSGARELYLDLDDLPAGAYRYDVMSTGGQVLATQVVQHAGTPERYAVSAQDLSGGIYFLRLSDADGAARTWGFVVR